MHNRNIKKAKYVSMGETLHNDVIYVAVNQDVRESKSTLLWTLKTLPVKKLCLLHVHIPFSLNSSCKSFRLIIYV